jgi:tetratricopeptide (TPR) repeat protein
LIDCCAETFNITEMGRLISPLLTVWPDTAGLVAQLCALSSELERWGHYALAEPSLKAALQACEQDAATSPQLKGAVLQQLGALLMHLDQLEDAQEQLQRSLDIFTQLPHSDHWARVRNDLGWVLKCRGQLEEAKQQLEWARLDRMLYPRHDLAWATEQATTTANLAVVLQELGDQDAESMYMESFMTQRHALGPYHPDTLTTLNNIAYMHKESGQYVLSAKEFREVLASRRRVLGPSHPLTIATANNLGAVLRDLGNLEDASSL